MGLFKYYTLAQLPNFAIAAPMVLISTAACWSYFSADWKRTLTLGLRPSAKRSFVMQDRLYPHMALWLFLLLLTLTLAHVQIAARLFSFQPAVYWCMADLYAHGSPRVKNALLYYTLGFALVGTILFMNFYPPA